MSRFKIEGGDTLSRIMAATLFAVVGLAISRLLYEGLFPRFLWLGRPLPVLVLTAGVTGGAWLLWRALPLSRRERGRLTAPAVLSPLLLNLIYLLDAQVSLTTSRFLFAASIWLTLLFLARLLASAEQWTWLGILSVWFSLFPLYLLTMPSAAGRADTFEFQTVIPQLGIAHPTGYPLYLLLGRLFAALPLGSVAWRINLASAVFAATAASLLFLSGRRLWKEPLSALLAALLFGLTPTFWSQAVEAEVYALHALFIAASLWLIAVMLDHGHQAGACRSSPFERSGSASWQRPIWLLALLIGLGLTNHLTTLLLLPAALLAVWLAYGRCLREQDWQANMRLLLKTAAMLLLPLLLYAYLPLRWSALHEEPMGLPRFVDWVIGGRFQGALQLSAWLTDFTRYEIVWRLIEAEWGWFNLLLALIGVVYAAVRNWRAPLVLLLIWVAYAFYAINYHVPDLAVFLIPAHAVTALFWGAGVAGTLAALAAWLDSRGWSGWRFPLGAMLTLLLLLPAVLRVVDGWPDSAYRDQVALQAWGEGVLSLPLDENAAILADSEKIAPLYYLQQAEGLRPDLQISVLPDEAAYRAEVDARIAAGQTVYLARYLPGLEGLYHLRSQGPLIEVSRDALDALPAGAVPSDLQFGKLRLLGYDVEEPAVVDTAATAVTLFWQMLEPDTEPSYVYVRLADEQYAGFSSGAHPAGNYYPTVAFRPGEVVADYHLLPRPQSGLAREYDLQVALGPQFAAPDTLPWQTAARLALAPLAAAHTDRAYRAQNGRTLLSGASFPSEIRPGTPLPVLVAGYAPAPDLLSFELVALDQAIEQAAALGVSPLSSETPDPIVYSGEAATSLPNGRYHLFSRDPLAASFCGWLAPATSVCLLGEVEVSGVPLPEDAANFDDQIALLSVAIADTSLQPGGALPVQLRWQSLGKISEDYTVFLQVLDEQDRLVGQVDAWPRQGTYPTSRWERGEIVDDPYEIQLAADLPPGAYRLQVGLYLLATLRRLPLLDAQGQPIDDKVIISGLKVE